MPGDQPVVVAQRPRPGEIGFALDETGRAAGLERDLVHRHVVDGGEAGPNHRHEFRRREASGGEELAHRVALVGTDVDHEEIRCIGRQARAPLPQQVVADQSEQQQDHEAEAEGDDLHDAVAAAARDVRESVTPGHADTATQRRECLHEQPSGEREEQKRPENARGDIRNEPRITHHPVEQREDHRDRDAVHGRESQWRRREITAQHPCRRDALQLQQWRQRESHQDHHGRDESERGRVRSRRRQIAAHEIAQEPGEAGLREISDRGARERDRRRDDDELRERLAQDETLRGSHALHQRDAVEMARRVAPCGHGHRDGRQQHAR